MKDIAHTTLERIKKENDKTRYYSDYIAHLTKVSHQSEMRTYYYQKDTTNQGQQTDGSGSFIYLDFETTTLLKENV